MVIGIWRGVWGWEGMVYRAHSGGNGGGGGSEGWGARELSGGGGGGIVVVVMVAVVVVPCGHQLCGGHDRDSVNVVVGVLEGN